MATYYVDNTGGNNGNPGTFAEPWETLVYAAGQVAPGDHVYIRGGTYSENTAGAILYLTTSGTYDLPITWENYNDETVNLLSTSPAVGINLSADYNIIIGIDSDQGTWGATPLRYHVGLYGNHNIIADCVMKYGSSAAAALRGVQLAGSYNEIYDCEIGEITRYDGGDEGWGEGIWLTGTAHHNLIQGCTIYNCSHNCIATFGAVGGGASYNIIRANDVSNDCWRAGGTGGEGSLYNVFEDNIFHGIRGTTSWGPSAPAFQNAAGHTILRRNIFYDLDGHAVAVSGYVESGMNFYSDNFYCYHNTCYDLYNINTSYSCAMDCGPDDDSYTSAGGIHVINNIFYDYNHVRGNIWYYADGASWMIDDRGNSWYDTDPLFVDAEGRDFQLQALSPCRNNGEWLTTITSTTGSGTSFVVADVGYFIDGFGIVDGDVIQIEGYTQTAQITNVNYATNTITVNTALSWTQGDGVALAYSGAAPDQGAYEMPEGTTDSYIFGGVPIEVTVGGSMSVEGGEAWLAGWTYRKKITVDPANVDSDLTWFPLYIHIDGDADIGAGALSNGYDIRFTKDDGETELAYDRVYWVVATGAATAHFYVSGDGWVIDDTVGTDIYIYYGKADASDGNNPTAVWDAYYQAVYHGLDATTSTLADASGHNGTINKKGANEPIEAAGKVYKAQDFDGADDYINAASAAVIDDLFSGGGTFEAWLYADTWGEGGYGQVFAKGADNEVYLDDNVDMIKFLKDFSTARGLWQAAFATAAWKHFAVTYDDALDTNDPLIYLNGASVEVTEVDTPDGTPDSDAANNMTLGNYNTSGEYSWDGKIEEIRMSTTIRSAAWLKFQYANWNEADHELSWGNEESQAPTEYSIYGGVTVEVVVGGSLSMEYFISEDDGIEVEFIPGGIFELEAPESPPPPIGEKIWAIDHETFRITKITKNFGDPVTVEIEATKVNEGSEA